MADFKYVAVDAQGKTQSGEVSAKDGKEARSALRKQRLTPLKVSPAGGSDKTKKSPSRLTANSSAESDHLGKRKTLRKGSSKGEKIGFIGKTGSGKSTLLDLIMGLIEPNSGKILIDDVSLFGRESYRIKNFWQNLFMHVPQNIFLSDSSIAENIAFGFKKENIDFQKIQEVAAKAQINDFIQTSLKGLNTLVGERGVRLSGGQRQRIGIARALYKNHNVIFLDEATSALDEDTENKIMNAFNYLGPDVTIIIITHRLNTLKFCNRVFEIKDGKLIKKEI